MADTLEQLVARWKAATAAGDTRTAEGLEGPILAAARPVAERAAATRRAGSYSDDLAQETCQRLLKHLRAGREMDGKPEAFVWRIAENAHTDWYRRTKTKTRKEGEAILKADARADEGGDAGAEVFWLKRERQAWAARIVREAVDRAPANYRRVLQAHCLEEQPLEELAAAYYQEDVQAGKVDTTDTKAVAQGRKNARNRVDKHLGRARDWLKVRLKDAVDHEGGPS